MFKIGTHICNELKGSKIILRRLEKDERKGILELVLNKYVDVNKKGVWLWEKFVQYEALNDDKAWSYIKDFVGKNECIIFFNQDEEKEMFICQSGDDLNYVLSETCGFEFYVTDRECSYLMCFNHHNILYGCGSAGAWIKAQKYSA